MGSIGNVSLSGAGSRRSRAGNNEGNGGNVGNSENTNNVPEEEEPLFSSTPPPEDINGTLPEE